MMASKLLFLVVLVVVGSSFVQAALPVSVDSVEIDGSLLLPNGVTRLDVEKGADLNIEITLSATAVAKNIEVEAFIAGFEFNDIDRVADVTPLFDVLANVTYVKRLVVPIPEDMEQDEYKLRVMVSDRNNNEIIQTYNLVLDVPRHLLKVEDIVLTPENEVAAGGVLLAAVRIENLGGKAEEGVKVQVSIPELGVSATKYVDEVGRGDEEESEDVYLRLPECVTPGVYAVVATVYYADKHRTATGSSRILVTKNELCSDDSEWEDGSEEPKIAVTVGSMVLSAKVGGQTVFPITMVNNGVTSKSFSVTPSIGSWASVQVSPTAMAVLSAGKSQTFYVSVVPNEQAGIGRQGFSVSIMSGSDVLQQLVLEVDVGGVAGKKKSTGLKTVLEGVLVVLFAVLIILALLVGFKVLNETPPRKKAEPYY